MIVVSSDWPQAALCRADRANKLGLAVEGVRGIAPCRSVEYCC
jgi:hypothetical protein